MQLGQAMVLSGRPKAETGEPKVFYLKLQAEPKAGNVREAHCSDWQADYYRYLAEFLEGEGQREALVIRILQPDAPNQHAFMSGSSGHWASS